MNMKVIGAAALAAACVVGCCKKDEVLVMVNGQSLTRCALDKDVASLMAARKAQIPAEQMEQAKKTFEEQLAQKFLMETLLLGEAKKQGLDAVTPEELQKKKEEIVKESANRPGAPKSFEEFAAKAELVNEETMAYAVELMTTLNKAARDAMVKYRVRACTDVTGFALLGHACEMALGSDAQIQIDVDAIDLIPDALEFARIGILPEGMYRNRSFAEAYVDPGEVELAKQDLLYDPQTSGGLLIAVHPDDADALYEELKGTVPSAQKIGTVKKYTGGKRIRLQ